MLKPCTIVLGMAQNCDQAEGDLIGADRGALVCARQQRRMVMAIGDFDSVNAEEMTMIRQYADQVEVLPVMKDETAALSALHWAKEQGYQPIILTGGLGGRQDHQLANLLLVMYQEVPIILREKNNELSCLEPGRHVFKANAARFISFFAIEPAVITLEGFLYPLDHYFMDRGDTIGISNEIVDQEAVVTLDQGRILVVRCNDAKLNS